MVSLTFACFKILEIYFTLRALSVNKILLTDKAQRTKYVSRILKLLENFYFYILHFVFVRQMW